MTEPLFEAPAPAPLARPQQPLTGSGPVTWTNYSPLHPRRCDDCLQVALEALRDARLAPLARQARFKLSQDKKTVAFVCAEHRQIRIEDAGRR